jgi:hypothetical protein
MERHTGRAMIGGAIMSRRTIMVGFDDSDRARDALHFAEGLCAQTGGRLALPRGELDVLVIPPWPHGPLDRLRRGMARGATGRSGGCPVLVAPRPLRRPVPHDNPERVGVR